MAQSSRVFVDSSILVTALLSSRGGSFYLLSQYRRQLQFFINDYVLAETLDVLSRKFPKQKELGHNLYLLLGFSRIEVLPNPKKSELRQVQKLIEKEDAPILASALEHCDFLLTLDNDFLTEEVLNFAKHKRLRIFKPKEFIELLRES